MTHGLGRNILRVSQDTLRKDTLPLGVSNRPPRQFWLLNTLSQIIFSLLNLPSASGAIASSPLTAGQVRQRFEVDLKWIRCLGQPTIRRNLLYTESALNKNLGLIAGGSVIG
ncbi:MAG: hypothetical protein QNJ46_21055 [Leptolyngbyaceae cyanobacterium MO_188.B28]|nr:hypothetical protein [Leptolyngbyaceae cyanobacterium MO_188.B28]